MPRIEWPLLLSLQAATILTALWLTRTAARQCARQVAAQPTRRADALFQFGRIVGALPLIALIAPYVLWDIAAPRRPPHLGAWLFAVGWTGFVVTWFAKSWIATSVSLALRPSGPSRAAMFTGGLYADGWFILGPLFAGWAAVAFTLAEPFSSDAPDPTEALCFVFGLFATTAVVSRWTRSRTSPASAQSPSPVPEVVAAFTRAAGDGAVPAVTVARMERVGLPLALAVRRRRRESISIDAGVVDEFPPEETTAILFHELGHHRLGHLRRRQWTWKACLLAILVVPTLLGWGHVAIFLVGTWLVRNLVLLPQSRRQEFEADRFAADRSSARAIASALTRMHRRHDMPDDFGGARREMTHPDLVRRLEALGVASADVAPAATA